MKLLLNFLVLLISTSFSGCSDQKNYNVLKYDAVGDGLTMNTKSIQQAIDECHCNGGGSVVIPSGVFLTGTLYLKDNVHLYLEEGAVLKGSTSFDDYPDNSVEYVNSFSYPNSKLFENKALIFAEGVNNISVTGTGTIDGSGDCPAFQLGNDDTPKSRKRPCLLLFIKSNNIKVHDLTLKNSAYWLQNYLGCDTLHLKGLKIFNHTNFNQDATDIDASNVLVEDCVIDADDDGICLKSHDPARIVENITVRNCTIATNCNAIKFGTKSEGGFRNVNISNCMIKKSSEDNIRKWQEKLKFIELPTTVISGVALESVDGGCIENVVISDITMRDVQTPIFVIMARRNAGQAGSGDFYNSKNKDIDPLLKAGKISNITFKNIDARSHSKMTSSITASKGNYVENVTMENVRISIMGYGTKEEADIQLGEYKNAYPENRMYGYVYPSSGLFFRHVKNLTLKDIDLEVRNADYRPAVILEDVIKSDIINLSATLPADNSSSIQLKDCKEINVEAEQ